MDGYISSPQDRPPSRPGRPEAPLRAFARLGRAFPYRRTERSPWTRRKLSDSPLPVVAIGGDASAAGGSGWYGGEGEDEQRCGEYGGDRG